MAYKHHKLISHSSKGWKSEIRVSNDWARALFPLADFLCLNMVAGARELGAVSFIRALILSMRAPLTIY